jgi:hypothetical protein
VFLAALFIMLKLRKEPKCPTTYEWIKKMWYNGISFSYKEVLNFVIHKYVDGTREHHLKGR